MTLFDAMQQLSSESHAKWFERYFEKYNLEQKLKTSAQKGYTGYLINVWSVRDEYLRNRLGDERTSATSTKIRSFWRSTSEIF